MEGPAEDPLGGGEEGNREVEGQMEGPGPPGGWEVCASSAGLPIHHGWEGWRHRWKGMTP